ncbi:hypothetical protein VTI28DRAFT_7885 [Corynascus sepedonium]
MERHRRRKPKGECITLPRAPGFVFTTVENRSLLATWVRLPHTKGSYPNKSRWRGSLDVADPAFKSKLPRKKPGARYSLVVESYAVGKCYGDTFSSMVFPKRAITESA